MKHPALGVAALGISLTVLAGCGSDGRLPAGTPVVLVSIDTLRSDRLPVYGYGGVETPAIDALRKDGVLFAHAYAHTPLTLPSHASLLTGLLPGVHGVRDNVGYALDRALVERGEMPFLPALLRAQGYATGAAVSAFVLQGKTGLAAGFDLYEDAIELRSGAGLGGLQRAGPDTLRPAVAWLEEVAERPFFLFLHLYEPHSPYAPPEPYASRYRSPYDGEVAAADAVVGALLDELRRLRVYDRALILLLSDHGEGLGEHGEEEHGLLLYREAIQVPLLLKLPGGKRRGTTVEAPAQLIDIAPTIAALLGLPASPAWQGASLLALDGTSRAIYAETFYPRLHFGWSELASLVDGRHHLVDGPLPELFDLAADPGERTSVLAAERRRFTSMRSAIAALETPLVAPSAVDEETRRAMEALGYIGSGGGVGEGPLPDPRTELGSLAALKDGFRAMHDRDWTKAEATFAALVASNPQMVDGWEFLGRARFQLGRPEEALAAYQEALRRSGGAPHVAQSVASLLFDLGRLDDAAAHARLVEASLPSFAHGLLARIALRRRDLDVAEREARLAMEDVSDRLLPRLTLAEVLHARGRYEEALALVREAEALYRARKSEDPDLVQGLHLLAGKALADLGDAAAAEAAFREEIRLFPKDPRAYSTLAVLLALTGRGTEAAATLEAMTKASPTAAAYAEAVRAYRALGDDPAARAILAYALRRFPDSRLLVELAAG